jgi:hypothetical protein
MDKDCQGAKDGPSRYSHEYSYRSIEVQAVLLKQTNCYLFTAEVSNIFTQSNNIYFTNFRIKIRTSIMKNPSKTMGKSIQL